VLSVVKIQRRAVLRHVIFPNFGNGLEVNVAQRTSVNYPYIVRTD
jgi:hypothetical protein